MKHHLKRGLSLLLTLALLVSVTADLSFSASAETQTYNWGTRGVTATYLSDAAQDFYEKNDTSYEILSTYSGASNVNSVPSSALYKQLQTLMTDNHDHITTYAETRDLYQYTDCQNGGGKISSFYSGVDIGPAWDGGSTWNREHTWPNSKGLDGSDEDDIMMLRPTAKSENSGRGNKAYGESTGYYNPNAASGGAYDLRGDVARIMLYTYVRWGNTAKMWGSDGVIENKTILLKWMEEDPVDTWELGRNDVVETITGTRNVFVDYPELAFCLFDAEVPADMTTPSGSAHYTVTATVNDASYGSVSVSGNVITATPGDDYRIEGYEVVSGDATVVQIGDQFVVTTTADCTVQINFVPKPATTVCFWENGTMTAGYAVKQGDAVTLPAPESVPEGYTFLGWSTSQISDSTVYPAYMAAGINYVVNENTNLFALYSYTQTSSASESYVLVTDASQLTVGSSVVIAAAEYDYALSTNQKTNNRGQAAIVKNSNDTITLTDDVAELVLGEGSVSGTYSFYCSANSGYLYCASASKSNYLKTTKTLDEKGSFAITVNTDGSCDIVSQTTTSERNVLRYNLNNGDPLFSCYASGQKAVSLYVKTAGGSATCYTTGITLECAHENTHFTGSALYCDDCGVCLFNPETHIPGDINGDGEINNKDATRLFQYLSGWKVDVVEAALDVNNDGSVNNKDATRLFQYLSGWNVDIY